MKGRATKQLMPIQLKNCRNRLLLTFSCLPSPNGAINRGGYHTVILWVITHTSYLLKKGKKKNTKNYKLPNKRLLRTMWLEQISYIELNILINILKLHYFAETHDQASIHRFKHCCSYMSSISHLTIDTFN